MSKTIHIHIHRAPAKDAWEESKHKRAANGQFGSGGGGGAAKPAAKSASASKPAIAVKQANRGSGALAQLQAQSNAHLKKTGFGHLVTPLKNAPGTGTPKKSFEQQVKETRAAQLAAAARKSLGIKEPGAKSPAPAGPKSFEQQVKETRMKQLAAAGAKSLGVKPAAPKADNPQNVALQLAARKDQLKELQAEMKTGKYSPEDVAELKNKEASLKRMIANYEAKSAPAPKSLEAQAREHEDTAAKHHVAAQAEFKKNGKTDEYVRLKNLAQKHTNLGTDLINQAVASSKGK